MYNITSDSWNIDIAPLFDNNERYDTVDNPWTMESPMPTARHGLGV
jgi:hypothetical protein